MKVQEKRVVIVTGGNRGIGKAIVHEFAANGDIVYVISRHKGEEAGAVFFEADIRDIAKMKEILQTIYKENKKIDILVNNAGIMEDALIGMISSENILEQFQINTFSVIELTQLASRFMKRNKKGSIINIASIIGVMGNAGQSVYSATKGAVISFTKSAAKELSGDGIRVNAVAPGIIQTDLIDHVPEEKMKKRIENISMGRTGLPEEVAKTVVFLASDDASYISGQIIGVDGGAVI